VRGRLTSTMLAQAPNSQLQGVGGGSTLYVDYYRGRWRDAMYVQGCKARRVDLLATNGVVHVVECVPEPRDP